MRETSTDYRHPFRPAPLRWLNRAGRLGERVGLPFARLDPDSLLHAARRRTGLFDLGEGAEALKTRLGLLVRALEEEARLHPFGRLMARENLVRILGNRLRLEAHWRAHPEIAQVRLAPPVIIVGLQRTGTTVLHRLLSCDPAARWLASYEAVNPAPPPEGAGPLGRLGRAGLSRLARRNGHGSGCKDARVPMAYVAERSLRYLAPDFFAIHPVQAGSPEEDCLLFDYDLSGTVPEALWHVPSFSAHVETLDKRAAYRFLERMLRYLAWQRRPAGAPEGAPVRWVLKTPQHLEDLDALLSVFPQARLLQTHRDPARVLTSFCSMMAHSQGVFSDAVDPLAVAAHWRGKALRMVTRSMAMRERLGPLQEARHFLDVSYERLVADPLAEVRRIYAWTGLDLSAEALCAMEVWRASNPQHRHGRHAYRAEDFGLHAEALDADFAAYRDRFRIAKSEPAV